MAKVATKLIFRAITEGLRNELPAGVGVARYEGDPEIAVEEHIQTFGDAGSFVVVGFDAEGTAERTAQGNASLNSLPIAMVVLQRRDGNNSVLEEAERLDDLMDTVKEVFNIARPGVSARDYLCSNIIQEDRVNIVGGSDWFGREIRFNFIRDNI